MKNCSTSLAIREIQIKVTVRCHYIAIRKAKTEILVIPKADKMKRNWVTGTLLVAR